MRSLSPDELGSYWLGSAKGMTPHRYAELTADNEPAELLAEAGSISARFPGLSKQLCDDLIRRANVDALYAELDRLDRRGVSVHTLEHDSYPRLLREIDDRPPLLYCIGDMERIARASVAVVGTRSASPRGISNTEFIAGDLAARGVTVVSGMASGIDAAAHRGALDAGGVTVAVLGCGIDKPYPAENVHIYKAIAATGVIISEYPPGYPVRGWNFPYRNRIISGLSKAVLVCEGREKSGAMITAEHAVKQGRALFAMPGDISVEQSELPNTLLRSAAMVATHAADITEHFGWNSIHTGQLRPEVRVPFSTEAETARERERRGRASTAADVPSEAESAAESRQRALERIDLGMLDGLQTHVCRLLAQRDMTMDELIEETDSAAAEMLQALSLLEALGITEGRPGRTLGLKL